MATPSRRMQPPLWFWAIGALGLAWNLYGVVQFARTAFATEQALIASGMTTEQAALYASLPTWMTVAFAVGVLGGVAGSLLLLLRRRLATPVFAASLLGYIVLYAGDITQGVFAAFGTEQVLILTLVVVIAAGLLVSARRFTWSGVLA